MGKDKKKRHIYIPEDLFLKIASGEEEALERLYYLTYKPMYAFLLSLTLNKEDADDLLQDTYIRIREAAHLYKKQGNPMAWMMKIAKNIFLMKKRKEKGKETINIDDLPLFIEHSFCEIGQIEDRIFLEQLFANLKTEERDIIIMNVMMGMTFREISEIENKPIGTILSKYHRAMKKLQTIMNQMERRR